MDDLFVSTGRQAEISVLARMSMGPNSNHRSVKEREAYGNVSQYEMTTLTMRVETFPRQQSVKDKKSWLSKAWYWLL
jgi:hypothetical protein